MEKLTKWEKEINIAKRIRELLPKMCTEDAILEIIKQEIKKALNECDNIIFPIEKNIKKEVLSKRGIK